MKRFLTHKIRAFAADEDGMVTHFALTTLILILIFAGMSLDSTNAWRTRFILQTAADAAARAAIRELPDENAAIAAAVELAEVNLASTANDSAVTLDGIALGNWDPDAESFTADQTPLNAVRVKAERSAATANALPTYLLGLVGFQSWDVGTQSVAYRSTRGCKSGDISTNGTFSLTSNNDFFGSFCVEAAEGASLNTNNYFDDNNRIFVTDLDNIDWPSSVDFDTIVGRGTTNSSSTLAYSDIVAVDTSISAPFVADVEALADNYLDPYYDEQPSYINTSSAVITITANDVASTDFEPGRIYEVTCGGSDGPKATFANGAEVSEVVIVSDCRFDLAQGSSFEDVVLVTRDTGNSSVSAASGVRLGADDDCESGGEALVYTGGDFSSASGLELHGALISAGGEVSVAASSEAMDGVTIWADGDVSFSAAATFGTCSGEDLADGSELAYLLVK